jgi:CBS domain containing-hemolysin-like protein
MPDTPAGASSETRNLPVPVPTPLDVPGEKESFFARLARALFGWKTGPTRADLQVVLESTRPGETGVSITERTMLKNILALHERRIEDVMVPRADIVAVQQDISLGELMKVFENAAHSRLVVYNDTLDDPTGMVHIRDLIAFMTARATESAEKNTRRKKPLPAGLDLKAVNLGLPLSATKIVRQMLFVPPSMPALDLLAKMQATHIHLALVVDEYGGTDGIVSIEDIVEQIVGDISDEHDEEVSPGILRQPDGSFIADARANLEDVTAAIGAEFNVAEAAEEVDTLGGYLMAQVGRLPLRGELVPGPAGFEIEVLDSDPRRIKRVRIHRSKDRLLDGKRRDAAPDTTSPAIAPAPSEAADESRPASSASETAKNPRAP